MTKEERLASVGLPNTPAGVAQFYDLFPDMESHDNYLANGGQPTAKEFFNFGATTNLNIPFGNFAYGGGPCMDCGGYMQAGGNPNFMDTINGITKANRKTFKSGSTIQGGANNNIGNTMREDFKGTLATYAHNALLKEEQQKMLQQFTQGRAQYGGDPYGINYGEPQEDQTNYQNQAFQDMYQSKINQYDENLRNDTNTLFQTLNQAQYGMPVGPNFNNGIKSPELIAWLKNHQYNGDNVRQPSNPVPQYTQNTQQTKAPVTTTNNTQANNAASNYYLQDFQHKKFGPWSKTRMTFNRNQGVQNNGQQSGQQNTTQSYTGDPSKRPYQHLSPEELHALNPGSTDMPTRESKLKVWMDARRNLKADAKRTKDFNNQGNSTKEGISDYLLNEPQPAMTNWDWYDPNAPEVPEEKFGGPMYQFGAQVQYDQFGNPIDPNKQMMKRNTFGSNATDNMFGTNNIFKGDNQRNTFGTPKPQENPQTPEVPQGPDSFTVKSKQGPSIGSASADMMIAGINTAASMINKSKDDSKKQLSNLQLANNVFKKTPANVYSQGDYDPNSGMFRVDQHVPLRWNGYRFKQDGGEGNSYTTKPNDGWFHPFDFGDRESSKSPMEKNKYHQYLSTELEHLKHLGDIVYGSSITKGLSKIGISEAQNSMDNYKKSYNDFIKESGNRAREWAKNPENKQSYLEHIKGLNNKQDGGETDLPTAKDGFNMKAGLYGTNGNRQFSLPMNTQAFSKAPVSVRQTLEPVDREDANLEAEKGETAVLSVGGIPAHFNIGGKKHSAGGTPLSLPDDSFIFSDTKGMLIKDPVMLAQFGMVPTKAGYTPADIAKKFDINKFRKILSNSDSEALEVKTAEMMIANYNMKLAKLALLQESMKGFPQGIPKIAMPYIEATQLDPAELIGGANQSGPKQMDPNMESMEQGQQDEPDQDMGVARYGGLMQAQNGAGLKYDYSKELSQIEKLQKDIEKENLYRDSYAKLLGEWQNKHNTEKAYKNTQWTKERQAQGIDEQIKRKFDIINKHAAETGTRDSKVNSREWKYDHRNITQHKEELAVLLEKQKNLSQDWDKTNLLLNAPTYKSQEEYDKSLLQPYSDEKRIAQVSWLKANPKTVKPKVAETKAVVKETLEDLGEVTAEEIKALVSEGYHFIANGKTY